MSFPVPGEPQLDADAAGPGEEAGTRQEEGPRRELACWGYLKSFWHGLLQMTKGDRKRKSCC